MSLVKGIKTLLNKELRDAFEGSMLYIFCAIFSFVIGAIFYNNLTTIKELTNKTIVDNGLAPTFQAMNFLLMIFAPMLTMGVFVKEKREHTMGLLKLSKLTETQIFWGKYLATLIQGLFIISPSLLFPIIMSFSGFDDWAMIFTNYLGVIGLLSCYLIVGVFASLVTKNYIVSIVLSFGILFSFLILFSTGNSVNNDMLGQVLRYASLGQHSYYFSRGALVSYDFIYFGTFIGFFSYISVRILGVNK